ncbi:transmembrane protein 70 homolog, mitochondrial [Anoplophora glabripennis]|nr:transmembrane protein 70 homolog, mitochondrial [Anoplophora glabripennis]
MSLRKYCKVFPQIINYIKNNNTLWCRPVLFHLNQNYVASCNSHNKVDVRFSSTSTSPKRFEKNLNLKQIYYGVLTPQIRAVKIFSLSSSIVGIVAQPFLYKEIAASGNVPVIIAAYSFIGFFTVVTPILLHLVTKKYITHLEYNAESNSYIAKTVNFLCMTKETEFKPEEVKVPDVPGLFTTFFAKGKALFLDPRLFDQPEHYAKIMGFDKPLDFKLNEKPPPQT